VALAKKYPVKLLFNPGATTGVSRRLGVQAASGDIIAFIDADNELPHSDWLKRMVLPLAGSTKIAGTIPIILVKKSHPAASRLYSLMQANPLISFAFPTGLTTESKVITEQNYFPFGGNGTLIRKSAIIEAGNFKAIKGQEDVDLTFRIVKLGYNFMVMSDVGIYHLSHRSLLQLNKKMYVRILNFVKNYSSLSFKFVPSKNSSRFFLELFLNVILLKSFVRVVKGFRDDKDNAWLYYPLVFYFTVVIFGLLLLCNKDGWKIIRKFGRGSAPT
jgi:cellulose synthase/poly-beta-1,6-N-acetylglucosamine synthase-like glycosyltransferase